MLNDALKPVHGSAIGHYENFSVAREYRGMDVLRDYFPSGEADELNFVLFSTSGIHGSYCTIEQVEFDEDTRDVTFLIIRPRVVSLIYGNADPETPEDFAFLKKLRASSHAVMQTIGEDHG